MIQPVAVLCYASLFTRLWFA